MYLLKKKYMSRKLFGNFVLLLNIFRFFTCMNGFQCSVTLWKVIYALLCNGGGSISNSGGGSNTAKSNNLMIHKLKQACVIYPVYTLSKYFRGLSLSHPIWLTFICTGGTCRRGAPSFAWTGHSNGERF